MPRKRKRTRSKQDEQIISAPESSNDEAVVSTEKPAETHAPKEAVATKAAAKPVPSKTQPKKGPSSGEKMNNFLKEVKSEMKKVSWPDKDRTTQSTGIVIVMLVVLSLVMAAFTIICTRLADIFFGGGVGVSM